MIICDWETLLTVNCHFFSIFWVIGFSNKLKMWLHCIWILTAFEVPILPPFKYLNVSTKKGLQSLFYKILTNIYFTLQAKINKENLFSTIKSTFYVIKKIVAAVEQLQVKTAHVAIKHSHVFKLYFFFYFRCQLYKTQFPVYFHFFLSYSVNIVPVSQKIQTQMAALLWQKQKCYINVYQD